MSEGFGKGWNGSNTDRCNDRNFRRSADGSFGIARAKARPRSRSVVWASAALHRLWADWMGIGDRTSGDRGLDGCSRDRTVGDIRIIDSTGSRRIDCVWIGGDECDRDDFGVELGAIECERIGVDWDLAMGIGRCEISDGAGGISAIVGAVGFSDRRLGRIVGRLVDSYLHCATGRRVVLN